MSVTEIATFQLVVPYNLQSAPLATLLKCGIRNQISYESSTPVYLFTEVPDRSAENQEVMKEMVPEYITFKALAHPGVNFSAFPSDISTVVVEK
ncbi:hypothetical protein DXG01_003384 [Tephrocybe rancida]|nr:hypothetical protein DXG01_003384 [Tephrocybe rancida]